jgi:hypothetical protein
MALVLIALAALLPAAVAGVSLLAICDGRERKVGDGLRLRLSNKKALTSSARVRWS